MVTGYLKKIAENASSHTPTADNFILSQLCADLSDLDISSLCDRESQRAYVPYKFPESRAKEIKDSAVGLKISDYRKDKVRKALAK